MNWDWAASLDQIWRSPNLPLYLTLAAAGFVGIIVLITLLRSERSVANGVLALITLLAIGVAGAVTFRGFGTASAVQSSEARPVQTAAAPLPQLSCIDELAGDAVLAACEKALFGSAESVAAAVAYAASQITLLTSLGDVATANKGAGSDLLALRRAVERDRYGLMAYVLTARDRCTPTACRAFRSLTEPRQIAANMEDRVYESLVMRYAASWNTPQAAAGHDRGAAAVDADGQAHQRRIPDLGLHPAGQHHDARAAARRRAEAVAGRGCAVSASRAASGRGAGRTDAGTGRSQEAAAGAEAAVLGGTGPAHAVGCGAHS